MEESRGAEGGEHHGQKSTAEVTTNTVYTILQQQPPNPYRNSLYSCYYYDNFETNIKQDYESHVVNTHAGGKLCYPSKADLATGYI
jgi:hypothetical protein